MAMPLCIGALPDGCTPSIAVFINGEKIKKEDRKEDNKWIICVILC
jgi:hypothetical protein